MRLTRLALISAAAILVVACASPSGPTTGSGSSSDPQAMTRIDVRLTDALRMEPASMHVPVGVPITFVVTNDGAIDHEFFLGDEDAQAAHDKEMGAMGGMTHDEPAGIALKAGETKELTYTFTKAGKTVAGCHVVGHYGGGMRADVTVGG